MAKETNKKNKVKSDKKPFLKDFKSELKKVIWPTPKQLFNSTSTVIIIVLLTAALVFVLDFCFDKGYQFVIDKADKVVQSNKKDDDENTTESDESTVVESDDNSVITVDDKTDEGNEATEGENPAVDTTEGNNTAE
ncbi:MAG: preprotein translocase subunit SecE [Clostridia bacterium]|nr:preprotein translocase subunit SecE [Clostridia bacterium]